MAVFSTKHRYPLSWRLLFPNAFSLTSFSSSRLVSIGYYLLCISPTDLIAVDVLLPGWRWHGVYICMKSEDLGLVGGSLLFLSFCNDLMPLTFFYLYFLNGDDPDMCIKVMHIASFITLLKHLKSWLLQLKDRTWSIQRSTTYRIQKIYYGRRHHKVIL
jgi:hypothetical protein